MSDTHLVLPDFWEGLGLGVVNIRFYHVRPDGKTMRDCRGHGEAHNAYSWGRQVDPGWSVEQVEAYLEGYGKRNCRV